MKHTTIQLDVADPRLPALTEALSNPTARRVLTALADGPETISGLVTRLHVPFSTVDYTVKKLYDVGLLVHASQWWSVKGKSVTKYALAQTQIVISPRPLLKGVLPALLGSGLFAALIRWQGVGQETFIPSDGVTTSFAEKSVGALTSTNSFGTPSELIQPGASLLLPDLALWFLLGSFVGIALLLFWNFFLHRMKGGTNS